MAITQDIRNEIRNISHVIANDLSNLEYTMKKLYDRLEERISQIENVIGENIGLLKRLHRTLVREKILMKDGYGNYIKYKEEKVNE